MTAPNFEWAKPKSVVDPAQPQGAPSFDWAASPQEKKQQGFIDYLGNFVASWATASNVKTKMEMEQMHIPVSYEPHEEGIRTQMQKAQGIKASGIAMNDFFNFFGQMFHDTKDQLAKVVGSPGETLAAIKNDPIATAGQFGKAFITPIVDLAEIEQGIRLTEDDFTALTPEEKAGRIKSAVATGAMLATGAAAGKAIKAGFSTIDAMAGVNEGALAASRLIPKGDLSRRMLKGLGEAGAGGTAYGLVRRANESDQLSEALINGVVFAPLGVAGELLLGKKGQLGREETRSTPKPATNVELTKRASDLSQVRQVQGNELSFKGVMNTVDAMSDANTLTEAIVTAGVAGKEPFMHIDGAPMATAGDISIKLDPDYKMSHHYTKNGDASILVYDKKYENMIDDKFFANHGLAKNQIVSYDGNNSYVVTDGDGRNITLTNLHDTGDKITVPMSDIRKPTRFEMADFRPEFQPQGVTVSQKGKLDFSFGNKIGKGLTISPEQDMFLDRVHAIFENNEFSKSGDQAPHTESVYTSWKGSAHPETPITSPELERAPVRNFDDVKPVPEVVGVPDFTLPPSLSKAAPKYQMFDLDFESDYDRAAYILAGKGQSRSHGKFLKAVKDAGLDVDQVMARGKEIRNNIKVQAGTAPHGTPIKVSNPQPPARSTPPKPLLSNQPLKYDDVSDNVFDNLIDYNLTDHIDNFLQEKGVVDPVMRKPLVKRLETRLRDEVVARMPEEDRAIVERALPPRETGPMTLERLTSQASTNKMTVGRGGSGRVILRDMDSNRILAGFDSYDDAATFINKTGQADGVNLDPGAPISGDAMSGGKGLPPIDAEPPTGSGDDFVYKMEPPEKGSRWEFLVRGLDNSAMLTRMRDWTTLLDTKRGTTMYADAVEPLQRLSSARNAQMTPWIKKGAEIEKIKLTEDQMNRVGEYIETRSPEEIIKNGKNGKPLNPMEQSLGRQIADANVDLDRIFPFMEEVAKLEKEFGGEPDPIELGLRLQEARDVFGIDAQSMEVVNVLKDVFMQSKNAIDAEAIIRLARSYNDGTGSKSLSRAEFAKKFKLSPEQLKAADKLEGLFSETSDAFAIPEDARGSSIPRVKRGSPESEIFTGQAKEFFDALKSEKDRDPNPLRAYYKYVKDGFDEHSGFTQALQDAQTAVRREIKKLPQDEQTHARNRMNEFLDTIRGYPQAGDKFAQSAVDHIFDQFGMTKAPEIRSQIVNLLLSTFNAAMIGARPAFGVIDLATGLTMSIARRDVAYTNRMIQAGTKARLSPEIMEAIRKDGGISSISPIASYTKEQFQQRSQLSNQVSAGMMKASEVGFQLSGQPLVYETLSAGHFLTTKADAYQAITKFTRGDITWKQLKKQTFLDTHYAPVIEQFKKHVKAGQTEEAANLLGREAVQDMLGIFGDGSQPTWMGTNWGRLLGQWGNWPMWLRSSLTSGLTRGTVAQRIGFGAKFAALAAIGSQGVSKALGVDISKANPLPALAYSGGLALQTSLDLAAYAGGRGYTRDQAKRRLERLSPVDPQTGKLQPSPLVPGSYAVDGWGRAVHEFERGHPVRGVGSILGFRRYRPY